MVRGGADAATRVRGRYVLNSRQTRVHPPVADTEQKGDEPQIPSVCDLESAYPAPSDENMSGYLLYPQRCDLTPENHS